MATSNFSVQIKTGTGTYSTMSSSLYTLSGTKYYGPIDRKYTRFVISNGTGNHSSLHVFQASVTNEGIIIGIRNDGTTAMNNVTVLINILYINDDLIKLQ